MTEWQQECVAALRKGVESQFDPLINRSVYNGLWSIAVPPGAHVMVSNRDNVLLSRYSAKAWLARIEEHIAHQVAHTLTGEA